MHNALVIPVINLQNWPSLSKEDIMVEGFAHSHGDLQPFPILLKKLEVMETLAQHCFDCWKWKILNVYTTHQMGFVWLTS